MCCISLRSIWLHLSAPALAKNVFGYETTLQPKAGLISGFVAAGLASKLWDPDCTWPNNSMLIGRRRALPFCSMGPVRIHYCSHNFATQSSYSVDKSGVASKNVFHWKLWLPWRNAQKPHPTNSTRYGFTWKSVFEYKLQEEQNVCLLSTYSWKLWQLYKRFWQQDKFTRTNVSVLLVHVGQLWMNLADLRYTATVWRLLYMPG